MHILYISVVHAEDAFLYISSHQSRGFSHERLSFIGLAQLKNKNRPTGRSRFPFFPNAVAEQQDSTEQSTASIHGRFQIEKKVTSTSKRCKSIDEVTVLKASSSNHGTRSIDLSVVSYRRSSICYRLHHRGTTSTFRTHEIPCIQQ